MLLSDSSPAYSDLASYIMPYILHQHFSGVLFINLVVYIFLFSLKENRYMVLPKIISHIALSICLLSLSLHLSFPPFSDEDRFSSVSRGAREDLCHARPHHARRRHQGPDHAVRLGRP